MLQLLKRTTGLVLPGATALLSAGVLSIAVDVWQTREAERELRLREQEAEYFASYDKLTEEYLRFLALCLEHIDARACLGQPDAPEGTLGDEQAERRALMYEYVFSIFERAYLRRDVTPAIRETVWPGWDAYIRDYLRRPSFRATLETWRYDDGTFGMTPEFELYIDRALAEPG